MPKKAKTTARSREGAARKRADINVLIVDDEKNLTQAMRRLLSAEGYRAEVAASGELALEAIKELPFDIILLDINMPGMNGLEAFKKLRKVSPKSKVIMITGYGKTLKALVEEARELGVHSIIDKPFKINQITDAIQEIIPHAD
jgi:DNA-binding NtrC family response regulator